MHLILLLALSLLLLFGDSPVITTAADDAVELKEWLVPWENSRPRDPFVANDGKVWFVGQRSHYVAYLEPETGKFTRLDLGDGAGPHNLIVSDDGMVWYAGNSQAHIGKLDPATGKITKYPMPDPAARDPHTLVFNSEGDIWFTMQRSNMIGKLETKTGKVHLITVPTQRGLPYGIKIDAQDNPWVVLFGTNKFAAIDAKTMKLKEIELPRADARPRRLEITPDGMIYYVDYAKGFLGQYNPKTKMFKEWASPGGEGARAYRMASDDKGRIWYVESGLRPNMFVGFDPKTEKFISNTAIESGGGTVRHMFYHQPKQEIWFGTDTNYIGRAKIK